MSNVDKYREKALRHIEAQAFNDQSLADTLADEMDVLWKSMSKEEQRACQEFMENVGNVDSPAPATFFQRPDWWANDDIRTKVSREVVLHVFNHPGQMLLNLHYSFRPKVKEKTEFTLPVFRFILLELIESGYVQRLSSSYYKDVKRYAITIKGAEFLGFSYETTAVKSAMTQWQKLIDENPSKFVTEENILPLMSIGAEDVAQSCEAVPILIEFDSLKK